MGSFGTLASMSLQPTSAMQPGATARPARRRRGGLAEWFSFTRQTWIAASSAAMFVVIALTLALVPVPFVVQSSGGAVDLLGTSGSKPIVDVEGTQVYPHTGQLLALQASTSKAEALVSLPEAIVAHWTPKRSALPRELVYDPASSTRQVSADDQQRMDQTREAATVAGLRAAGVPVDALPIVTSVSTAGPAYEKLRPGDFIIAVNGKEVGRPDDIYATVAGKKVNEQLNFKLIRDGKERSEDVTVVAAKDDSRAPTVATKFSLGYRHAATVDFAVDGTTVLPTQALMLALAVYERASNGDLTGGRRVAGAGTIDARGVVGPVASARDHIGIAELLGSAEASGAHVMLVHQTDCADMVGLRTDVRVVPVATLADAVSALNNLKDPTTENEVPRCS